HRAGHLGTEAFGPSLGLVAGEFLQRAGENDRLSGNRAVGGCNLFGRLRCHLFEKVADNLEIARFLEELDDGTGDDLAYSIDIVQVFPNVAREISGLLHRLGEDIICAVMPGQKLGRRLADMADAERIDEAVERDRTALIDRIEQLPDADLAESVDILELGERRTLLPLPE